MKNTRTETPTKTAEDNGWRLENELREATELNEATIDDDSFRWTRNELDHEKIVRCVAFILEWLSDEMNKPIEGPVALGLSTVLSDCAQDMQASRKERTRYRIEALKGAIAGTQPR